jgi:hypothetical protein
MAARFVRLNSISLRCESRQVGLISYPQCHPRCPPGELSYKIEGCCDALLEAASARLE